MAKGAKRIPNLSRSKIQHSRATAHYVLGEKSRRYMSRGLYAPNENTEFRAKIKKVIVLYYIYAKCCAAINLHLFILIC
jgi:hypothetical protein